MRRDACEFYQKVGVNNLTEVWRLCGFTVVGVRIWYWVTISILHTYLGTYLLVEDRKRDGETIL